MMTQHASRWSALSLLTFALAACGPSDAPSDEPAETAGAAGDEPPEWGYEAPTGPMAWGTLSSEFAMCGTGNAQSPIDIADVTPSADQPELSLDYQPASLRIIHHEHMADVVNTGHSIQVNYPGADALTVGDETFDLLQFHFHSPSEHHVEGEPFDMEMHLVHRSDDGQLAVISALITEGAANEAYAPIWANLPESKGEEVVYDSIEIDMNDLLPSDRTAYRYMGSLTTPPCSEQVRWFVLTTPVELSAQQIASFRSVKFGNNRPVQALNGRAIDAEVVGDQ